ncbi:DUF6717 family protein [Thermopirellula anaerolimosa]
MTTRVRVFEVLAGVVLLSVAVAGVVWYQGWIPLAGTAAPSNSIMVLQPYRYAGTWVFDDPAAGLKREPFVAGIPEMIDEMVRDIPNAEEGFRLLFSTQPFPGYTHKLVWRRGDQTGNWYYSEQFQKEGWLCPALFKYFRQAPKEIYVKAEAK